MKSYALGPSVLSPAVLDRRGRVPGGQRILQRSRPRTELSGLVRNDAHEQPDAGRDGRDLEGCCPGNSVARRA